MEPVDRRRFLKRSSAAAAVVGVASAVPLSVAGASTRLSRAAPEVSVPEGSTLTEPVVAHLRDVQTGEVTVFAGAREITVTDKHLAALLFNATR